MHFSSHAKNEYLLFLLQNIALCIRKYELRGKLSTKKGKHLILARYQPVRYFFLRFFSQIFLKLWYRFKNTYNLGYDIQRHECGRIFRLFFSIFIPRLHIVLLIAIFFKSIERISVFRIISFGNNELLC